MICSEFGKDYTNYLSILQLVAAGMTKQSEIDGALGKNTGAFLDNLETEYSYLHHKQPMFSKPNGKMDGRGKGDLGGQLLGSQRVE